MLIKNFSELAVNEKRRHALEILNAGLEAVLTENAMKRFVRRQGSVLIVKGVKVDLNKYENIYLVGGGKAAAKMAEHVERVVPELKEGLVIDVAEAKLEKVKVVKGTHPLPSEVNVKACSEILRMVEKAGENDLVVTLISGGGSSLLAQPRIPLNELVRINQELLRSGADIYEVNAVRKHLSKVKGGRLSAAAHPASVLSIIISDVLGNDLSVIASGPTVRDNSTLEDVKRIIAKHSLNIPPSYLEETPKEEGLFSKTVNVIVLDNSVAVNAMKEQAESLGYSAKVLGLELRGEARELGSSLASQAREGEALIGAGETTVTVTGDGEGGRNQELVLGALRNLQKGCVASAGTDGIDNTDAAGAIADLETLRRAEALGLSIEQYLQRNDSYHFFQAVKGLIITGPTGTNVADIMLVLG